MSSHAKELSEMVALGQHQSMAKPHYESGYHVDGLTRSK